MPQCSRNELLVSLVNHEKTAREKHPLVDKEFNVAGCVHPLRPQMTAKGKVPAGSTVAFAVEEACKSAGVRKSFMRRGVAQIGTRDFEKGVTVWRNVPRSSWGKRALAEGELLRFRLLPEGGGGGGKNPMRSLLTVVVAVVAIVASVYAPQFAPQAWGALATTTIGGATTTVVTNTGLVIAGIAGLAVSTIGMVLVNAIAPIKAPSTKGISSGSESQVYGLSAGQNAVNQWGRVPAPLGRGRFAPPKAASPYTQTIGEDQYLHELLCLGIGDMDIKDLKIGTTAISEYNDCQYEIFKYDPANPKSSKLYPTGTFQEDLSIDLKSGVWNTRTTAECDKIELDFSFNGLTYYEEDTSKSSTSVSFSVQYRKKGSVDWDEIAMRKYVAGTSPQILAASVPSTRYVTVSVNPTNGVRLTWDTQTAPSGDVQLGVVLAVKKEITYRRFSSQDENWGEYTKDICELSLVSGAVVSTVYDVDGFALSLANGTKNSEGVVNVSGGYLTLKQPGIPAGSGYVTYTGAQTRLLRKTYTITPPVRGIYEVRVRRETADSTSDRLINASYWGAVRSVSSDLPVNTPYPVNLLAIKIKASGQISGALSTLTHYYEAKIPDYDAGTNTWVTRYTSNPASIFRYILQDRHSMARPQADSLLDFPSIQAAHTFWKNKGWEYNFVCDSDAGVFERLQNICAVGLASPTMVDGRWGIIVDKPRETIACAFTSANAWAWSFKRNQMRLPNAVHCTFVSEETWGPDMRVVATDEPQGDQYIYETQAYEGVNSPAQVYQLARFHYADAKTRRRTISLRCYDEAILCTRGDLVECAAPSISPHGLQVGRVRKIERDPDDNVVALYTDQVNSLDLSGRRFGVKVYAQSGAVLHAEIMPEDVAQQKLTFLVPQIMDVNIGDKYALGDYNEEVFQAIVLGMKFNSDWTCDMTLQDYVPQVYGTLSEPIPNFKSIITTPIAEKWKLRSQPIFQQVVADERALLQSKTGSLPRILVSYTHPINLDSRAIGVRFEISLAGQDSWTVTAQNAPLSEIETYFVGVNEGQKYDVRAKYVGSAGEVGEYTYQRNIEIIGRATPPPAPDAVFLNGTKITISQTNRPLDVVGHKVYMSMDEDSDVLSSVELTNPYTVTGTFDLAPWAGRAKVIFVRTVDEIGLLSDAVRVSVDLDFFVVNNIIESISEKAKGWTGTLTDGEIVSDNLISNDGSARYPQDGELPRHKQDGGTPAYTYAAEVMEYSWDIKVPMEYRGARVLVTPEVLYGSVSSVLFRSYVDVPTYQQNGQDARYPQDSNDPFYPQLVPVAEWAALPEDLVVSGGEHLSFKIVFSENEIAQVGDVMTVFDVEDKELLFQDVVVSSSGDTRITVPPKFFRAIKNVVFGIQYEEGGSAVSVKYSRGSELLDTEGYIELGPVLKAFDSTNTLTSANVDVRVRGY